MPRMLRLAASAAVRKPVQYVFFWPISTGGVRAPRTARKPVQCSQARVADTSVIEFANAELSACALCTAGVRARERETGADNVASTFTISCVRVEVRLQE